MSEKEIGQVPCLPITEPPGYTTLYPNLNPSEVNLQQSIPGQNNLPPIFGQPQSIVNKQPNALDNGSPQVVNYQITYYAPTYSTVNHREWINCCEDCCEDCCENMCLNCCLDCSTVKNLPSLVFGNQKNANNKANNSGPNYTLLENAIPLDASCSKK